MRHLIDLERINFAEWDELYALCSDIMARPEDYIDACRGKILATLFYEPSTRTNFSFTAAMQRLGGSVLGFLDPKMTSVSKGETLKDTIKMVSSYVDVITMRNPLEGAPMAASLYSDVPVINAGDGGHFHPTQTLTDLTTIMNLRGSIDGIHIGLCGDLKYGRTVHSLIQALTHFKNISFYLIAPRELAVPEYIRRFLEEHGQRYYEISSLESVMPMLDVLYMTRIQRERFVDPLEYERLRGVYILDSRKLSGAKRELLVMHPLPRVDEIAVEVDDDPRAVYFKQARFGMFARMALILTLAKQGRRAPVRPAFEVCPYTCTNPKCITHSEPYLPRYVNSDGTCAFCDKLVRFTNPEDTARWSAARTQQE